MQDRSYQPPRDAGRASNKHPARSAAPAEAILRLQAGAGNRAVASLARSTPAATQQSPVDALWERWATEDVEKIVALLSEQRLDAGEEQRIVDMVAEAAGRGSRHFDSFLLKLKTRVFSRSTARSGWVAQWFNAYDLLWHELEDERLERFARLVKASAKHGTKGPESAHSENLWSTLGKQEAMGLWGILKGMGTTLSGVADTAVWLYWKQSGQPLAAALAHFKIKIDPNKAPEITPWLSAQYDDVAKLMGREFGIDPVKDRSVGSWSAYETGEFGGKIVGALTMAGAGAGTAGKGIAVGTKVFGVLGSLKGLEDGAQKFADRLSELMLKDPPVPLGRIVTDEALLLEVANMLGNVLGAISGAGDKAAPTFAKALGKFGLLVDGAQLAPAIGKLIKDFNDPELAKDPEKREAAIRDGLAGILGTILSTAGSKGDEHLDARAKAKAEQKAAQNAAFDARYNQRIAAPGTDVRAPAPNSTLVAGAEGMHEFDAAHFEDFAKKDLGPERTGRNDEFTPQELGAYGGKTYDHATAPVNHSTLQKAAHAKLAPTGPNSLVKLVPAHYTPGGAVKGYVTLEKFVVGRTPAQLAELMGVTGLKDGVMVYRIDPKNVKPSDMQLRGYTQSPGGKSPDQHTATALFDYPVGKGAPQWDLPTDVPAKVVGGAGKGQPLKLKP